MKRAAEDKLTYNYGQRQWKEKPPGPEQLLLDDMFESGSITAATTPESLRQSTLTFQAFTPKVFGTHFRKTKARLGEFVGIVLMFPNAYQSDIIIEQANRTMAF